MRSARNGCRVLGGSPWHGGWRRIEPNPSLLGSYSSLIAPAIFTGPEWLPEFQVRSNKAGSTRMPDIATQIAGIDASKNHLDMAIHGHAKVTRVPNTVAGWKTLATSLVAAGVARAGIEATGGYERGVMGYLRDQGVVVTLLQPVQVKAFGMLHLKRAKTDRIDAVLIAACTQVLGNRNRMTPDAGSRLSAITSPSSSRSRKTSRASRRGWSTSATSGCGVVSRPVSSESRCDGCSRSSA